MKVFALFLAIFVLTLLNEVGALKLELKKNVNAVNKLDRRGKCFLRSLVEINGN